MTVNTKNSTSTTKTTSTPPKKYGFLYWAHTQLWFHLVISIDITTNVLSNLGLYRRNRAQLPPTSLSGKTAVITGGNSGIGKEVAKTCLKLGARVLIACRDQKKAKLAKEEILDHAGHDKEDKLIFVELDLSSLSSVRACAAQINRQTTAIDLLINNAGVIGVPSDKKSAEGFEPQFAINYLGHFLLTHLLMERLNSSSSDSPRIVNLSSSGLMTGSLDFEDSNFYQRGDHLTKLGVYGRSKLAVHLFTVELAKRLKKKNGGSKMTVYSVHPGVVRTEITRNLSPFTRLLATLFQGPITLSPEEGAQTVLHCALSEEAAEESGFYYQNCTRVKKMPRHTVDEEDAARIWELAQRLVGITDTI